MDGEDGLWSQDARGPREWAAGLPQIEQKQDEGVWALQTEGRAGGPGVATA